MRKPNIIVRLEDEYEKAFDEDNEPTMTTKRVSQMFGCTEQSLINAADHNKLPFGFVTVRVGSSRRSLIIPKLSLFNFIDQGVSDRIRYDNEYDLYMNRGYRL